MSLHWEIHRYAALPKLAWLAECTSNGVCVHVGEAVETGPSSVFEGAWAGPFSDHGFGRAATVVGSGATGMGNSVLFVPPSHTLEALYHHSDNGRLTVSNSPAFLVERLGAQVLYEPHLGRRFASAVLGIEDQQVQVLNTDKGPVDRVLHHNLLWSADGRRQLEPKPSPFHFQSYESYRDALRSEMAAVFANAVHSSRQHSYSPVSTCSSGYDSTACLVLGRDLGCDRAVTLNKARAGVDDSGRTVADLLRVSVRCFERAEVASPNEVHEFVATGMGGEDVPFAAFEPAIGRSVLLTGFHGDKIWSKGVKPNDVLSRGDVSGSSMGEFRLRCGFIHLPVPFIAALRHREVAEISNSQEMQRWSVGGWYDRPIPRRIAEEAGVPRDLFGMEKKAASLLLFLAPDLQPSAVRTKVEAALSALTPSQRFAIAVRERLFKPRLATARSFDRARNLGWLAAPLAKAARDIIAADPRLFEHDKPTASLEFLVAFDAIRHRYSVVGER